MDRYGLIFKGITDGGKIFHILNNSGKTRKVVINVFNTYFNRLESSRTMILENNVQYWNYVVTNSNDRIIDVRDYDTNETVCLFAMEGGINLTEYDYNSYARKIFDKISEKYKDSVLLVFNEINCQGSYFNDFVDISEGDTIVDIGFNYGLFSTACLRKNPSRVIGFEPNPSFVKIFKENFFDKRIEIHNHAISNFDGKMMFYEIDDAISSTLKEERYKEKRINQFEVSVMDINTMINNYKLEKINYLKVDCEGSEFDIFNSIEKDFLRDKINKIAIEYHDNLNSNNVQNLISLLTEMGFSLQVKSDGEIALGMIYAKKY